MKRFADKSVLLTGAATGIGRATAVRLASEGASVFAVDVNAEGLAETVKEVEAGGGTITTRVVDVTDEAAVSAAVQGAVTAFGGLDVLVNVAGIHRVTPLPSLTVADFRKLLDVNMIGTFLFVREAMAHLVERRGVVINTASTSATHAHPWMTAYAASKGAVLSFTLSLAAEYGEQGVRAVAVSPGGVATPLTQAVTFPDGTDQAWYGRITPQVGQRFGPYRFGRPEDVAATIAYAASPDAAYLTGVELRVDGGSHN
ncbi:SDR family NAD(P)-dependent oxidoreductase [Nonomuraea sp. NPDC050663]|uniref:SDR family NAD(P)-dependent oxidoreductase n=1 Tax=Nonomuraea sp. NPDC050663 TaxID=3364370 RepID=UPI0037B091FE